MKKHKLRDLTHQIIKNIKKNITTNKILPFNVKKDNSTNITIKNPANQQEGKFSETVGTGQGAVFNEIIKKVLMHKMKILI